jgi:hypothetical protein
MRRAMQLTLAVLETPDPQLKPKLSVALNAEVRTGATKALARMIAQTVVPTKQTETTDE